MNAGDTKTLNAPDGEFRVTDNGGATPKGLVTVPNGTKCTVKDPGNAGRCTVVFDGTSTEVAIPPNWLE